jgi:hypothetical protein
MIKVVWNYPCGRGMKEDNKIKPVEIFLMVFFVLLLLCVVGMILLNVADSWNPELSEYAKNVI